jgi:hypothetical protein
MDLLRVRNFLVPPSAKHRTIRIFTQEFFHFFAGEFDVFFIPFRIESAECADQVFAKKRLVNTFKEDPDNRKRQDTFPLKPLISESDEYDGENEDLTIVEHSQSLVIAELSRARTTGAEVVYFFGSLFIHPFSYW